MTEKLKLKVLDCTLRDGGYYNNWDFSESLVQKYLSAMSMAKVDIVEIGFRFLQQKKSLGKFAYSEDKFLNSISLPSTISYAVMINASDLINYEDGYQKAINILFSKKKDSPIDIVRIASHVVDIKECRLIALALKDLGYKVCLNIMQISSMDSSSIAIASKDIYSWNCIDVLYFADSFGNMEPDLIASVINSISSQWKGDLGIHTHDNKNQALGNSLKAIEKGANYIDATLLGMGRGAGNAKTEALLVEINQRKFGEYFPDSLFPIVLDDFSSLQREYNWGPNIYYFLSAIHDIHPTYIQEMSGDKRYNTEQILSAINFLKNADSSFYSFERMMRAISENSGSEKGSWSAKDWAREKNILIIGSGPSTEDFKDEIIEYIERERPIVLCLNINKVFPENLVSAYIACHESRILIESVRYSSLSKPIILPLGNLPIELKKILSGIQILDYGLRIQEGAFDILDNGCILDSALALTYAMSVASAGGAKQILLTGIDGYESSDSRQLEMIESFERYSALKKSIPIYAITPTTYPIKDKSIYISNRFD